MWERYENDIEITIENLKDEKTKIQYPLYRDCYLLAMKNIMQNVLGNIRNRNNPCKEGMLKKTSNSNIFAFIGGRGVGKTTALTEFTDILEKISKINGEEYLSEWLKQMQISEEEHASIINSNLNFIVMPLIDASILESVEDPFLLLLSGMLERCEDAWNKSRYGYECDEENKRQNLFKKFAEVYRNYHALQAEKRKESEELGESVISLLRGTPSTKKTKEGFRKLLDAFFETVVSKKDKTNYIVVVIDDLDLNIEHGFQMLERLHKFISHPNVIVLLAIDYKQMMAISENHFKTVMGYLNLNKTNVESKQAVEHCRHLANDYLDKLIPINQRVYMPNLVELSSKAEVKIYDGKETTLPYKAYYLKQIAKKMHIYCDAAGKKYHFNEPDTVRTAIFYHNLLQSLNNVDFLKCEMRKGICDAIDEKMIDEICNNQKEKMRIYDQNYEWFNSDIKERMLYKKADSEQRQLFKALLERDLERRGHYLIEFKKRWLEDKSIKADIDSTEYRYGDLLESIYDWGRKSLEDKPLIHCILASFTSEMVREYLNYMYGGDELSIKKSKDNLKGFFGKGFMSDWTNEMLPIVRRMDQSIIRLSDYREMELRNIKFNFVLTNLKKVKEMDDAIVLNEEGSWEPVEISEEENWKVVTEIIDRLNDEKFVEILQCIDMLLSNCRVNNASKSHVSFNFEIMRNFMEKEKLTIRCGFETETADFDIGGFIGQSIENRKTYNQEFTNQFIKVFSEEMAAYLCEEYYFNLLIQEEEITAFLQEKLKEQAMFSEERISEETIAFPFFDLDVSYNVIKRVRRACKERYSEPIDVDEVATYISEIYDCINDGLKKQKAFYGKRHEKGEKDEMEYQYQEVFESYPYIKSMKELQENKKFNEIIGKVLNGGAGIGGPEETDRN